MGVSWRVDGDVVGMMMDLIVDVSSTWCYMYCYFACYLCVYNKMSRADKRWVWELLSDVHKQ